MTLRLIIAAVAVIGLSACATVDLSQSTSTGMSAKPAVVEKNVVQRAAAKLYAAFSNKGWSEKASKKRVQSAASVLLKGLENKEMGTANDYASIGHSASVVTSDIREATQHVSQTSKAAEVYLAMAPSDRNVRKELASLEKALLISRQAETVFGQALENVGAVNTVEATAFTQSVDQLRDITNAFGDRVREDYAQTPSSGS